MDDAVAGDRRPACGARCQSENKRRVLVRVSDLHAVVRHLPARLQADVPREGVHAAAGAAADRRLHAGELAGPLRRREHQARDAGRFRVGRRRAGHRHAHPGRADPRHPAPRAARPARSRCWAGRRSRRRPRCIRTSTICTSANWATRPIRSSRARRRRLRRPPQQVVFTTKERLPLTDFPIPAYDKRPVRPLPARHGAILVGLPVPLRVLRHPGPLRPPAAHEDAAADRRRARFHLRAAEPAGDTLLRRRQFHRQPQGREGDAAASGRMAEAQSLSGDVRLRGDAQHRQADRHSAN